MDNADTTPVVPDRREWWKEAVIYQVYPRSFNDSDGDGIGDIPGVVEKVDYLADLGIDCVWLTPVYESPQVDNGYDVADYRAIDPQYGSMADWERLLEELHARGIRLVMDLVLNHPSDQHTWFRRSRREGGEYADYYIWREAADGYPNNWEAHFGGPAWSYDEDRGEYYLHLFTPEQPDLNWENPQVRGELYDVVSWWLERGIDGFRLDVINLISKAEGFPDGDPDREGRTGSEQFVNGPRMHEYFDELAREGYGDRADDIVAVGECADIDPETAVDVTGRQSDALDMTIFFEHVELDRDDRWSPREWSLSDLKEIMARWQSAVEEGAWVSLYHSNHDQPRGLSRFGDPEYRYESATMLATWLHGHRGTPFVYQGEEIGMSNVDFEDPDALWDVWAHNYWQSECAAGADFADVRAGIERFSRDNARTPMQWDGGEHAGFTDGEPWIPIGDDYETVNVAADRAGEQSVFAYYRDLIALRENDDVLVYGNFDLLVPDHEEIYAIHRTLDGAAHDLLVLCNFGEGTPTFEAPDGLPTESTEVVLGNRDDPPGDPSRVELRPYEAVVYRLR
ncbi:glucohydrolase [Halobacteriales archaeon SW_10_68_16]|nr:MAG: glucohydrolase [Halobacteriales archaeon SW_10_68_16]